MHGTIPQSWTETIVDGLRLLHKDNWSFGQITRQINQKFGTHFSRNAVLGKAHRIGLCRGHKWAQQAEKRSPSPRKHKRPRPRTAPDFGPVMKYQPTTNEDDDHAIPVKQRKTIMDLTPTCCRWPIGDPREPGFFFCGATKAESAGSYCLEHTARAHNPAHTLLGQPTHGNFIIRQATVL